MLKLEELKSKNIHIVGLSGTEGAQLALFLRAKGCEHLTAHDFCEEENFRENFMMFHGALEIEDRKNYFEKINALPIKKCFKDKYLENIEKADLVFVSQGWYLYEFNKPKLFNLKKKKIPFYTILNLYLSICKGKTIGVTGSNGKTTTSRLIYETCCLHCRGTLQCTPTNAVYVGNDRGAIQDLFAVEALTPNDFLVLEISNRQLKLVKNQAPHIGVVTNITPNHINEHDSFEKYAYQKSKIWNFQKESDFAVVNLDDEMSKHCLDNMDKNQGIVAFSALSQPIFLIDHYKGFVFVKNDTVFLIENRVTHEILKLSDIQLPGHHNLENVLAAISATYFAGISPEIIKEAISNFKGVEKRLEFMDEINGVKYYNDLASTTPESTMAAIKTFEGRSIALIIGGDEKGVDYNELAQVIIDKVDTVILMPNSTASVKLKVLIPSTMYQVPSTIIEAFKIAQVQTKPGGVVLLSPAGEGFFTKFLNRRTGGLSLDRILSEIKKHPTFHPR